VGNVWEFVLGEIRPGKITDYIIGGGWGPDCVGCGHHHFGLVEGDAHEARGFRLASPMQSPGVPFLRCTFEQMHTGEEAGKLPFECKLRIGNPAGGRPAPRLRTEWWLPDYFDLDSLSVNGGSVISRRHGPVVVECPGPAAGRTHVLELRIGRKPVTKTRGAEIGVAVFDAVGSRHWASVGGADLGSPEVIPSGGGYGIRWELTRSISAPAAADAQDGNEAQSISTDLDRPVVALVTATRPDVGSAADRLRVVFSDTKTKTAARVFRTVLLSPDSAAAIPALSGLSRTLPRIALVGLDGTVTEFLSGSRIKASRMYEVMKKVVKSTYGVMLDKVVKTELKLRQEEDRLTKRTQVLAEKIREAPRSAVAGRTDLTRTRAEYASAIKELQEVRIRIHDLWEFSRAR
jgi:hypothetical protein